MKPKTTNKPKLENKQIKKNHEVKVIKAVTPQSSARNNNNNDNNLASMKSQFSFKQPDKFQNSVEYSEVNASTKKLEVKKIM